jgi:hypothetical protein
MKTYLNPILLLAGLLLCATAFSQANFLPGSVFLPNGDTLRGWIDYQNWENNPELIQFRKNSKAAHEFFDPIDIDGFSVGDEIYKSGIIEKEVSPVKLGEILPYPEVKLQTDTAFLQVLIAGEKSLLYLRTSEGRDYFYIDRDGDLELLIYKKYSKLVDVPGLDKHLIIENKRFHTQLMQYLNGCDFSVKDFEKTEYKRYSLQKLFLEYYACVQAKPVFDKEKDKVRTEFGAVAGPTLTTLAFSGTFFDHLSNATFSRSVSPSFGLFLDLIWPRNMGRWSLYNELMFSSYGVTGDYAYFESDINYEYASYELGFSYLKMNNFLRFKRPVGNLFLFANAGISNGVMLGETNYQTAESSHWGLVKQQEGPVLQETQKHEIGFILGAGLRYRSLSLEMRYESSSGISRYPALGSHVKRYSALMGYRF